jgi:DnaJ family protein A protein 2
MENEQTQTFYEMLGIPKTASNDEIKKMYRKLSLLYHPDKTQGDPVKTLLFTKIKEAYDILCDPKKRSEYDYSLDFKQNGLSHIFRGNTFDGHGGMFREEININPEDIISHMFMNGMFPGMGSLGGLGSMGGLGGMSSMGGLGGMAPGIHVKTFHMKPQPILKKLTIPLHVSYMGGSIPIEIERVVVENGIQVNEVETVYVTIEKGIDNDEMIILEGKGHILQNSKGDVKIVVKIENNNEYERCGMDLKVTKKISLKEALTGFQFALQHLNGNTYNINNSKGNVISHNFNKKIPGLGMVRGEHIGNMVITFEVIFPERLEIDVIDKLSELL